ncbi:Alpha-mannosyltransferase [Penicillium waksmanii]|uniref:Alpha-mannosyltransferase n=1 Tax=Penicillium waksmanii TaxID=69791 RepID=UPI002547F3FD|nr:Alpha-mannosyltransferase [Penicillium waksmanii]KAJ5980038.1 Alpha-mannosyltransferase [Penicillium waksmanii]
MLPRSILRVRTLLAALLLASFLVWSFSRYTSAPTLDFGRTVPDLTTAQQSFWRSLHILLEQHGPDTNPLVEDIKAPTEGFNADDNARPRPDYVLVAREDVDTMREAHSNFLNALNSKPESSTKSSNLHLQYIPGTKGIVSTAGGSYLPVLVISLRMLRRTGSRLPMEVFLADEEEYEEYICDVVLPSLNARCIILSTILDASLPTAKITKYQFKPFAMLFSSFEEILFLDADAFPLNAPEKIFTSTPFKTTGMITWPDFWSSSVSPTFYEISHTTPPAMNLRASTESGEFVLSKRTHSLTLILATYYNYYGPSHYWPLLSQGAAGEGDKETFVAAAMALGEPFYQVSQAICALGHRTAGGSGMAGSAMAQFDPVQDYARRSAREGKGVASGGGDKPDVFFIHANFPKFNPATIFQSGHEVQPVFDDEGGLYACLDDS